MTLELGFTGTRTPITLEQRSGIHRELVTRLEVGSALHHGCCVGADFEAHKLAWAMGWHIVAHPPTNPKFRAWVERTDFWDPDTDILLPELDYIERNHQIVDTATHLIAVPDGPERARSGTWATVRYARDKGVPVTIIMPDGAIA